MAEGEYGVIPVSTEIYSDSTTPIEVLRKLKVVSRHVYLLESAEADKSRKRGEKDDRRSNYPTGKEGRYRL